MTAINLIPNHYTEKELALERAGAERLTALSLSGIDIDPSTIPAGYLPVLAQMWDVSIAGLTEAEARKYLSAARDVHRHAGTAHAVKRSLEAVFPSALLYEPHTDPLLPAYHFRCAVGVDGGGTIDQNRLSLLAALVGKAKNVRSIWEGIEFRMNAGATLNISAASVTALQFDHVAHYSCDADGAVHVSATSLTAPQFDHVAHYFCDAEGTVNVSAGNTILPRQERVACYNPTLTATAHISAALTFRLSEEVLCHA